VVLTKYHFASRFSVYAFASMTPHQPSKAARVSEISRRRTRVLFVVSRERPDRYESLARAFAGDRDVRVIFDRRRIDRRQENRPPLTDRRRGDRRSGVREWAVRKMGWIRVPLVEEVSATRRASRERLFVDS
jgi:hypothetical protein